MHDEHPERRRRLLGWGALVLVGLVLAVGAGLAGMDRSSEPLTLDPTSTTQTGTRALVRVLERQGTHVDVVHDTAAAVRAAGTGGTVFVDDSAGALSARTARQLARTAHRVVLVTSDSRVLSAFRLRATPSAEVTSTAPVDTTSCPVAEAEGARTLTPTGIGFDVPAGTTRCLPSDESGARTWGLVRADIPRGTVTLLGATSILQNGSITAGGNAAFALNLLGGPSQRPGTGTGTGTGDPASAVDTTRVTDTTQLSDATRVTDITRVTDATRVTDVTQVTDATRVTDPTTVTDATEVARDASSAGVTWFVPTAGTDGAAPSLADLAPVWLTPVLLVGALVALAAAFWRGRRLGPVVVERLPVVVRAAETAEGRARLYARTRDRTHALDTLRIAAIRRISRRLGLARGTHVDAIVSAVAVVTGRSPADVGAVLVGGRTDDDRALVAGADAVTDLERAVIATTTGRNPSDATGQTPADATGQNPPDATGQNPATSRSTNTTSTGTSTGTTTSPRADSDTPTNPSTSPSPNQSPTADPGGRP